MANSYFDIGSNPIIFPFAPNWISSPSTSPQITRYFIKIFGGSSLVEQKALYTPLKYSAEFQIQDRNQLNIFLEFIKSRIGRVKRFWVEYPKNLFTLAAQVTTGDFIIKVFANQSNVSYFNFERIFIRMNDGDIITRKVESTEYDATNDLIIIELKTQIDRIITLTNHYQIGRFLLVRFNQDEFRMRAETDTFFSVSLELFELVKEYEEIVME